MNKQIQLSSDDFTKWLNVRGYKLENKSVLILDINNAQNLGNGYDYIFSFNQFINITNTEIVLFLHHFINSASKILLGVKYNKKRTIDWWISLIRRIGIISQYEIISSHQQLFITITKKGQLCSEFKDLVVVGNSAKELGTDNGKIIDSYPKVARMNNFMIKDEHIPCYGKKTNYWISSFNCDIDKRSIEQFDKIFCPVPIFITSLKYRKRKMYSYIQECIHKIEIIPYDYFMELKEYVPNPSTGIAFLFWMYKEIGKLYDEQVYGVSFFNPDIKHHYFDDFNACRHDGNLEHTLYTNMVLNKL